MKIQAQGGVVPAQIALGRILYSEGALDAATKLLEKAAQKDNSPSVKNDLGACHFRSGNEETSLPFFREAAKQGSAVAQFNLGLLYDQGRGVVKRSYKKAAHWFQAAAKQGFAPAQFRAGMCFKKGRGVKKNKKIAAEWLRAAASGDRSARQVLYIRTAQPRSQAHTEASHG